MQIALRPMSRTAAAAASVVGTRLSHRRAKPFIQTRATSARQYQYRVQTISLRIFFFFYCSPSHARSHSGLCHSRVFSLFRRRVIISVHFTYFIQQIARSILKPDSGSARRENEIIIRAGNSLAGWQLNSFFTAQSKFINSNFNNIFTFRIITSVR